MSKKKESKKEKKKTSIKYAVGVLILIVVIVVLASNFSTQKLLTSDRVNIAYDYYQPENNPETTNGIILLHQFEKDKSSFEPLIPYLKDYHVIAIDFRGFGKSDLDYKSFSNVDYKLMINDVEAAIVFLKEKGVSNITIIGASIGANIGMKSMIFEEVKAGILLSPGLTYRGIDITETAAKTREPVLMITSSGDGYSGQSAMNLRQRMVLNSQVIIVGGNEHGTDMLNEPLIRDMMGWLKQNT